jgi:hypothetical protein
MEARPSLASPLQTISYQHSLGAAAQRQQRLDDFIALPHDSHVATLNP